jgi:negative regulator of flagellin synthesis FlgM
MKVTDKAGAAVTSVTGGQVKKSGEKGTNKTSSPLADLGSSAKLDLSARAQDLKKAKEVASVGVNDIDESKVAKFQKLIDNGQYKVNARAVAEKMVDEHLSNIRAENGED